MCSADAEGEPLHSTIVCGENGIEFFGVGRLGDEEFGGMLALLRAGNELVAEKAKALAAVLMLRAAIA